MADPLFAQISEAAQQCPNTVFEGIVYRMVGPVFLSPDNITSGIGARRGGGRWNPQNRFATVYTSTTPATATDETFAANSYFGIPDYESLPRVMVAIDVRLDLVLDLTSRQIRRRMRLTLDRIRTEDWRLIQKNGDEALTQAIGRAAFDAGFDGLVVPSALRKRGVNVVIFPENLQGLGRVVVRNVNVLNELAGNTPPLRGP